MRNGSKCTYHPYLKTLIYFYNSSQLQRGGFRDSQASSSLPMPAKPGKGTLLPQGRWYSSTFGIFRAVKAASPTPVEIPLKRDLLGAGTKYHPYVMDQMLEPGAGGKEGTAPQTLGACIQMSLNSHSKQICSCHERTVRCF